MGGSVLTIGNFDGVHVGHAALVRRAREIASAKGARIVAIAFDPHPASVLRPGTEPPRLTTWAQREQLLRDAGADEVVRLDPTPALLSMTPEEFVAGLVAKWTPIAFVEGADFRFGRKRGGDLALLAELGRAHGFEVIRFEPVEIAFSDHTVTTASSTVTRWLLEQGRVTDAAIVLGRPYELDGEVVRGDRRGREIGFPTANLSVQCLAPADGVYAGVGVLPDGRRLSAAISVGTKPTFGEHRRAVEAFLMSSGEDRSASEYERAMPAWAPLEGLPEYGWRLRLRFMAWVRDQMAFGSIEDLLGHISRDCERVREIVGGDSATTEGSEVDSCR
jgi:riboflavin kinase / FMN adenylyltransferase